MSKDSQRLSNENQNFAKFLSPIFSTELKSLKHAFKLGTVQPIVSKMLCSKGFNRISFNYLFYLRSTEIFLQRGSSEKVHLWHVPFLVRKFQVAGLQFSLGISPSPLFFERFSEILQNRPLCQKNNYIAYKANHYPASKCMRSNTLLGDSSVAIVSSKYDIAGWIQLIKSLVQDH